MALSRLIAGFTGLVISDLLRPRSVAGLFLFLESTLRAILPNP